MRLALILLMVVLVANCAPQRRAASSTQLGAIPADTAGGIGPVIRAVAAIDRLDWDGFRAEIDSSDFTFSVAPIAGGRPMTDWADVQQAVRSYFDSTRTTRPRLGLKLVGLRASDTTLAQLVYMKIEGGPIPGWWSFMVGRRAGGVWRIALFYAVGEPEQTRHPEIPLRPPSNGELYVTAHVASDCGWLAALAGRIVMVPPHVNSNRVRQTNLPLGNAGISCRYVASDNS